MPAEPNNPRELAHTLTEQFSQTLDAEFGLLYNAPCRTKP